MNSFWEQDAMQDADCIIVGGGLIGLLTALVVREKCPRDRIMLLESGLLPSGASSRNAGFACFGSLTELLADIDAVGLGATVALVARRWLGLARLRERVGDIAMDFRNYGGYELLTEAQLPVLAHLQEINEALRPLFGGDVFTEDPTGLAACKFGLQVRALVHNRFESQLHSGKLMRALALQTALNGIEIRTGAKVQSLEENGAHVVLKIANPHAAGSQTFRAARVALCTNALTAQLTNGAGLRVGIEAARGQVLMTAPVAGLPWRGCYHFDEGYYYFRNVGDRVLLGGGRNRDFAGEHTTELGLSEPVQNALESMLRHVIFPRRDVEITHRWAGLMGFTVDKQPVVRLLSPRIAVGFGCNGMGVAMAADTASRTAALLCRSTDV
ncbi:MAG: FAD-dependent oxidoreductase [Burkholderiaceae bacterium]